MSKFFIPQSTETTNQYLKNPYGDDTEYTIGEKTYGRTEATGWYFGAGNPEFWHFKDSLLVPGGNLLDIGCADGRSSLFFALNGMRVTGTDPEVRQTAEFKQVASELGVEVEIINSTIQDTELAEASFDTVLLDHTFAHSRDRQEVTEVLEEAWRLLKPGGYMWLRANGIEDSRYWEMESEARRGYKWMGHGATSSEMQFIEEGLIEHPCNCSGEVRMDRSIFFEQLELPVELAAKGAEIVHLQCIPFESGHNKMFGEDFNREHGDIWQGGTVTVIARKPFDSSSSANQHLT